MREDRFSDRHQAGRALAAPLRAMDLHRPIVFALPRGGVPVAAEVAAALNAPLDLVLVRKIGAPMQPELAVGAVVDAGGPVTVLNESVAAMTGAGEDYIERVRDEQMEEIRRRRKAYFGERKPLDPAGRDAVVVDDGLATGATALAAVRALKAQGAARVILAVPVAPPDAVKRLSQEADHVVSLITSAYFSSVGQWYDDFHQLEDDEVVRLMEEAARRHADGHA